MEDLLIFEISKYLTIPEKNSLRELNKHFSEKIKVSCDITFDNVRDFDLLKFNRGRKKGKTFKEVYEGFYGRDIEYSVNDLYEDDKQYKKLIKKKQNEFKNKMNKLYVAYLNYRNEVEEQELYNYHLFFYDYELFQEWGNDYKGYLKSIGKI